jgi:hypothetical protein
MYRTTFGINQRSLNLIALGLLLATLAPVAQAQGISVEHAEMLPAENGWQINADFKFNLSKEVEEAVNKGVALHFLVEFVLMEPNKYWFDQEAASASLPIKLSYHALSRQYLVNSGTRQANFTSLQEAMDEIGKLRAWEVHEKDALKKDTPYYAMLRMRLDQNKLPKPIQVSAIGSEQWNLISDRHRWTPNLDRTEKADKVERAPEKPEKPEK